MTAEKQAIWVWEEFENIRSVADPSKSGITKAIGMILETSDDETGMMAPPIMGILLFSGHRLLVLDVCCALRVCISLPGKVRTTWVERQVESILSICQIYQYLVLFQSSEGCLQAWTEM